VEIQKLREAVREDHESVERSFPILSPSLTLSAYRDLLSRLYAFVSSWEDLACSALPGEWKQLAKAHARAPLLEQDLRTLGISPDADLRPVMPRFTAVPELLGGMYVMEGSRLGGQHIARHLESRFQEELRGACRYFRGFGTDTGMHWRNFLKRLEALPEEDTPSVVRGAKGMFAAFEQWVCARKALAG
jgi:heme oxygenase